MVFRFGGLQLFPNVERLVENAHRLVLGADLGRDAGEPRMGQRQVLLQRRVVLALAEEPSIVSECGLEQLFAQRLETGHAEQAILTDPGEIIVHSLAGESEILFGHLLLADGLLLVGLGPAAGFCLIHLGGLGPMASFGLVALGSLGGLQSDVGLAALLGLANKRGFRLGAKLSFLFGQGAEPGRGYGGGDGRPD